MDNQTPLNSREGRLKDPISNRKTERLTNTFLSRQEPGSCRDVNKNEWPIPTTFKGNEKRRMNEKKE